jgi:hypothetical protein
MDKQELTRILEDHAKWHRGEGGPRAYLSRAYLSRAYLSGADLSGADLSKTIIENINWLSWLGITAGPDGSAYAYKYTNAKGESSMHSTKINYETGSEFEAETLNTDASLQCTEGIHLATLQWCLANKQSESDRLWLFKFNATDSCCPVASDGKFRVKKCTKIGECDWNGNLLKVKKSRKSAKAGGK